MKLEDIGKKLTEKVKNRLKLHFEDKDYMVIAVPRKEPIRVYTLKATNTVKKAQLIHGLPHVVAVAAGRAMCGALLLTSLLKHATTQKLLLKITGTGAIKGIFVEADGYGRVRCFVSYVEPQILLKEVNGIKKLSLSEAIGEGTLSVTKDLGFGEPYTGIVPLVSGEIARDIAYYLYISEQIPSAVSLGVLIDSHGRVMHAGGFLIQPLGGASEKAIQELEERAKAFPPVSQVLREGKRPEDMVSMLLDGMDPYIVALKNVDYFCPCSEEIVRNLVKSLSEKFIEEHFKEHEVLEFTCKFCKSVYTFTKQDIDRLRDPSRT